MRIKISDCLPDGKGPNRFKVGDTAKVIEKLPEEDKYDYYLLVERTGAELFFMKEEVEE